MKNRVKSCAIFMMSQNVTRFATEDFIHCKDRADSGIEQVGMDSVAGDSRQASYRKTSYIPTTYMNSFSRAQGMRML